MEFDLESHTILLVIAGSRSYGLHSESSDVDVKGICVPPIDTFCLGLHEFQQADAPEHIEALAHLLNEEEQEISRRIRVEGTIYDIEKFIKLALNANPNILEVLFCEPEDIRWVAPAGDLLREHREIFLSKKVVWSYQGYAFSQMKRIKSHRAWLLSPPREKPKREDFGLPPERSLLTQDEQNAFLWLLTELLRDKIGEFRLTRETREELEALDLYGAVQHGIPDEAWPEISEITGAPRHFVEAMQRERKYRQASQHWKAYLGWKENRNAARKAIEEVAGYDAKHGMHLARLMIQGLEILRENTLVVKRTDDRDLLLGIRNGEMPFEELEEWFDAKQAELKAASVHSSLPEKPDHKAAEELLIEIRQKYG